MGEGAAGDIYTNDGSLKMCYEHFLPKADQYEAVICTNDFAAISLVRHLEEQRPDILEKLMIIGCAEACLTSRYADKIWSVCLNFQEYGKAAVTLLGNLRKNPFISNIIMMIKWDCTILKDICPVQNVQFRSGEGAAIEENRDIFYSDYELREMMMVERLLRQCTGVDELIIENIIEGRSYEKIAELCFLTESSIKYRVKRMETICQVSGRRQLSALMGKYLQRDS